MAGSLLDAKGRPISSTGSTSLSLSERLSKLGVVMNGDGGMTIPPDAIKKIRADRYRQASMSKVPSTRRYLNRDAGGLAVEKGGGEFGTFSLRGLRRVRKTNPILQAIHRARLYQVRRVAKRWTGRKGDVGWRVVHRNHMESDRDAPEWVQKRIRDVESVFLAPAKQYHVNTTGDLMCQLWEDLATINRPVAEVLHSGWDGKELVGVRPVDGALILPTLLWLEKWARTNPNWWRGHTNDPDSLRDVEGLEIISTIMGHDIAQADFCLVRDGVVEQTYGERDLIVAPWYTRTDVSYAGYPPGHVEDSLECALSLANTWDYNSSQFTRGLMTEFIIGLSGDFHDDDIIAFVDMLRESGQGVRNAHAPPVMPLPVDGTISKIDLKQNNRDMQFETWMSLLVAIMCACYRMDTSEIQAKPWAAGAGASLSEASRSDEIALAKEQGLQGDAGHLVDAILTPLAQRAHPDLMVVMEWGDYDPRKEAEVLEVQGRTHRGRNELRREAGDLPWGFCLTPQEYNEASDEDKAKHDANVWNWPTDPGFAQSQQMAMMSAQEGEPGEEPGEEPEPPPDDGFGSPADAEEDGFGMKPPTYPYGQQEMNKARRPGRRTTIYVHDV